MGAPAAAAAPPGPLVMGYAVPNVVRDLLAPLAAANKLPGIG